MEVLLEIIMTIILDGSMEAVTEKKIPLFIRIAAAVFLFILYGGFCGFLIYLGIVNKSGLIIGIALFLLVMIAAAIVWKYKKMTK